MGLDLTIIPVVKYYDDWNNEKLVFDHMKLRFVRDYEILEQISNFAGGNGPFIPTQPLPKKIRLCITNTDRSTRKDKYGSELSIALACDMQKIKWPKNTHPFNNAIKAFIDALPANTPIVLYWE
jgi:hypothetical protein